jgi:hypothetical protein
MDKYNRSGIYQMKCLDCPLKYIGQTRDIQHQIKRKTYKLSEITIAATVTQTIY